MHRCFSLRHTVTLNATSGVPPWQHAGPCQHNACHTWKPALAQLIMEISGTISHVTTNLHSSDYRFSEKFASFFSIFSFNMCNIRHTGQHSKRALLINTQHLLWVLKALFKWLLYHCLMLRKKTSLGFASFSFPFILLLNILNILRILLFL